MLFSNFPKTLTTSSGTVSFNTPKFSMGYLRQIIINPATSTTVYDLVIIDQDGYTVLPTQDQQTINLTGSTNFHKLDIPMVGVYTVKIQNSTADEAFSLKMLVQED